MMFWRCLQTGTGMGKVAAPSCLGHSPSLIISRDEPGKSWLDNAKLGRRQQRPYKCPSVAPLHLQSKGNGQTTSPAAAPKL